MSPASAANRSDQLGYDVIRLSQEELIAAMPYLDRVLLNLPVVFHDPEKDPEALIGFGTDGKEIHTFSGMVLETYMQQPEQMNRLLFHTLMHCLFRHMYDCQGKDRQMWNLCTDIAVESMIMDLDLPVLKNDSDEQRMNFLTGSLSELPLFNARAVYDFFQKHPDTYDNVLKKAWMFQQDRHDLWYSPQKVRTIEKDSRKWKSISDQIQISARNYELSRGMIPGTITRKLHLNAEKVEDWTTLLEKFIRDTEEVRIDPESFDYVMYTYGLQLYRDMPLIEPLEYRDDNLIHDFVIAIDTSASINDRKLTYFLEQTRPLLESSFFNQDLNVHIIQCDAKIQDETVISSVSQFDEYIRNLTVRGSGGTDFRPVFEQVDTEIQNGTFHDLRGLIYFTDGNGVYPSKSPSYETAFVIVPSQQKIPDVPPWAVRINMNGEQYEY